MKRLILIVLASLALQGMAQEVEIRQTINKKVHSLIIEKGWDVRFIQQKETAFNRDSLKDSPITISIIVPEELETVVQQQSPFECSFPTLTLKENKYLPKGTIVEIRSRFNFSDIILHPKATVSADNFVPHLFVNIYTDAKFTIGCLNSQKNNTFYLHEDATLEIDTLQGICEIYDYDGTLRINNYQQQDLTIKERVPINYNGYHHPAIIPNGEFIDPQNSYIQRDTIRNITIRHYNPFVLSELQLTLGGRIYIERNYFSSDDYQQSPYFSNEGFGVKFPLLAQINLNEKWSFSAGLQLDILCNRMWHNVAEIEGDNITITHPETAEHNYLFSYYLSLPIKTTWGIRDGRIYNGISFDITPGILLCQKLHTIKLGNNKDKDPHYVSIFNPWKLEVGITWVTNVLGPSYGFRFFTNLLPQYRKDIGAPRVHTLGFEWQF